MRQAIKRTKKVQDFLNYFSEFYGEKGLYPQTVPHYTESQVLAGIQVRGKNFDGDSLDRELIRDMILITKIEHCLLPKTDLKKFCALIQELKE